MTSGAFSTLTSWSGVVGGRLTPRSCKISEVRFIVEPQGARLAAVRRNFADLAALDSAVARMRAADGDGAATVEADLAFHRALLGAAHNELPARPRGRDRGRVAGP